MKYRLFIYKTTAAVASAPAIGIVNDAISQNSDHQWREDGATAYMEHFDTESIIQTIKDHLTDLHTNRCKCWAVTRFPPKKSKQIPFIYIATSYAKAPETLPKLHAIAAEQDLVLYDAETGKTFYRDLVDRTYITMRLRQQALHNEILKQMIPVWKIQRLSFYADERDKNCDYVVTLRKKANVSFHERVQDFYRCLSSNLVEGEKLLCEDRCYKIVGQWYQITYILEGYKKHANQIGYDSNCSELLNRMGAAEAFKWMKHCSDRETDDIFARMNFTEMTSAYPNPADRFVVSVNITKWQRKQVFNIRYSQIGLYGSEIIFHIVPDEFYQDGANISVLKLEEESATFVLPFIYDIYPDFYQHYYLEKNHLSQETWERILNRLEDAKAMILHDTFNPALAPYIKQFNLFVLGHSDTDYKKIKNDPQQFLYAHRYAVSNLYDVFIRWSNAQLDAYCRYTADGRLFNIQGP